CDVLNTLLGNTEYSTQFWNDDVKTGLDSKFPSSLSEEELKPEFFLKNSLLQLEIPGTNKKGDYLLFMRLQEMLGFQMESLERKAEDINKLEKPFDTEDIID